MLKDEILEKIFSNKEMQMIPIGCQSTAVSVFEDVIEELRKEVRRLKCENQRLKKVIVSLRTEIRKQDEV